jgi:cytochrome c biogenesis protein CcmG, thiol:disulfide interchange protein DsbE
VQRSILVLVVVAATALAALLVYGVASQGADTSMDSALQRGERVPAPDRTLPILDAEGRASLHSYRGQVVVLNFWASWCDPCRKETPLLQRTHERIRERGGTVLGVTWRDTRPDARAFVRAYELTYPSLRDVDGELAREYGTAGLPETFVIDRHGRVTAKQRGTVDEAWLRRSVDPLLDEARR